jgi:hypothetical protein
MAVTLYRGTTFKVFDEYSFRSALKEGWSLKEGVVEPVVEEIIEEVVEESEISLRSRAKKAGIKNWYNLRLDALKARLEELAE